MTLAALKADLQARIELLKQAYLAHTPAKVDFDLGLSEGRLEEARRALRLVSALDEEMDIALEVLRQVTP